MKRIYLDYAATTPVDQKVAFAMEKYLSVNFGNANATHSFGQSAAAALDSGRAQVAQSLSANEDQIIFTGSATEANNLALRGVVARARANGRKNPQIIVSSIEHESVLATAKNLAQHGVKVLFLPVTKSGIVDLAALEKALTKETVLVSLMYANNEVGTIQPISKIAALIKAQKIGSYPLFHTDAVQAFPYLSCEIDQLGVDLLTISSHKMYGPKGAAALFCKDRSLLAPIITGGGQEFSLRSGTENLPAIVGFAKATEIAAKMRIKEGARLAILQKYLFGGLRSIFPNSRINGSTKNRLPNNLNILFPGYAATDLLIGLDLAGIAVSAGSACAASANKPSQVLAAIGLSSQEAKSSLRITLGRQTKKADLNRLLQELKRLKNRLK